MKKHLGIFLIIALSIILRLIFLDKPEGLWNDEYVSYMTACTKFSEGFIQSVKAQCHMPFYYLYLKFFMTIFGQSDIILRLTSVFAGVLSVIAMYFVGLENDKKTGLLCAGFTAISSFAIYYSQEVRMYSVLFLFSAMALLFSLKCIKTPNKNNLIFCILFNFLILFTHTIGFVFVFFNLLFLSINLHKQYKNIILKLWTITGICGILLSPTIYNIFTRQAFSQWWGHFTISKIGFLFTDYFSPVLTNLTNAPDKFLYTSNKLGIYMLIPTLIGLFCILKSLINNKINQTLLIIIIGVISVLTGAALCGKLVFITKYSIEIYPILIFLACSGAALINNKILRNILISIYCFVSLFYITFAPNSAPKMNRPEGHKIVGDILKSMNLKQGDIIFTQYYGIERLRKYFDFTGYRIISINKQSFPYYLSKNIKYNDVYKNGKNLYRDMFASYEVNKHLENSLKTEIVDALKPGQSVVMVVLKSVSWYNPEILKIIAQNDQIYDKEPLLFLVFSYIKIETFKYLEKTLTVTDLQTKGDWIVIKFTKLNNEHKK